MTMEKPPKTSSYSLKMTELLKKKSVVKQEKAPFKNEKDRGDAKNSENS